MGHAIPVRMDYTAGEVRRLAQRAKDAAQARRLLAIAAVLEGALREEAAKIGGMDRHSPEDHVHRATRLGSSRSLNLRIGISTPWRREAFRRSIQWIGRTRARPQPIVATVSQHQGESASHGEPLIVFNRLPSHT